MKKWLLLVPALAIAGCEPPMTREQLLIVYRSNCLDYGFAPGTPEFAACVSDQDYRERELFLREREVRAIEDRTHIERDRHSRRDRSVGLGTPSGRVNTSPGRASRH